MSASSDADNAFFYLSDRKLFFAQRGKKSVRHLSKVENIMEITPKDNGGLILKLGDNKARDVALLYDPKTGAVERLKRKTFGPYDDGIQRIVFAKATGELLASHVGPHLVALR